jgi:tRNA(Ile)-lysidine synthase
MMAMHFHCGVLLLSVSRAQFESFAKQQGLSWIEDESNVDTRFSRNFLRQDIVPLLQTHWPSVTPVLAATAVRMQEANLLLDELAAELAALCVDEQQRMHIPALQKLSPPRQRLMLRYWLQQGGFRLPDEAVLAQILMSMLNARSDAAPCVTWQGGEVRRYQDHLYALSPQEDDFTEWQAEWDMQAPLCLPDGRWLTATGGGDKRLQVQVRFRQGGEHLHRHGMTQELKKLLQSQSVPPWERGRSPLLFKDGELVRVVGTALCATAWPSTIIVKIESEKAGHAEQ